MPDSVREHGMSTVIATKFWEKPLRWSRWSTQGGRQLYEVTYLGGWDRDSQANRALVTQVGPSISGAKTKKKAPTCTSTLISDDRPSNLHDHGETA